MWNVIYVLLVILLGLLVFATILALLMPNVRAWLISHRRGIVTAVAVVAVGSLAVWWMWPSGTPSTPSAPSESGTWQSPSPGAVWEFTKSYWLLIAMVLGIPFGILYLVQKPWAKDLQRLLVVVAAALFIGLPVVNFFWGEKQAEKQVLPMSPGGKSQLVPVPQGMTVMMRGEDFRYHCVYGDGHEESYGKGEPRCPDGHMPFVYATNSRAKEANVVTYFYAYARK